VSGGIVLRCRHQNEVVKVIDLDIIDKKMMVDFGWIFSPVFLSRTGYLL